MDIRYISDETLTLDRIDYLLEQLEEADEQYKIDQYHNDYAGVSWAAKRIRSLKEAKEFIKLGQEVKEDTVGLRINNKFIIARNKKKWRVSGKGTWYWYSNPETFVKKYIEND